jgi:hypothetical protein
MLHTISHNPMIQRDLVIDRITIPEEFFLWIHTYITEPIRGFEHKKNPDGSYYTTSQQITATRKQAIAMVHDFLQRGKSEADIFQILYLFKS